MLPWSQGKHFPDMAAAAAIGLLYSVLHHLWRQQRAEQIQVAKGCSVPFSDQGWDLAYDRIPAPPPAPHPPLGPTPGTNLCPLSQLAGTESGCMLHSLCQHGLNPDGTKYALHTAQPSVWDLSWHSAIF